MSLVFSHNVSHETNDLLSLYCDLLLKWNKAFSLTSAQSKEDLFTRHLSDASDLLPYILPSSLIIDLGSGNGLPGIPIAILTKSPTVLIEANQKKAAFLRTVASTLKLPVRVISERIEDSWEKLSAELPDSVTILARAFGRVEKILSLTGNVSHETEPVYLLNKSSKQIDEEVKEALENWDFSWEILPITQRDFLKILRIRHLKRKSWEKPSL